MPSTTRNELRLPDIAGYETLTGDFHIHTVFSDGKVWPDVRVNEAWRDGLDVIAVTDHLEYRPHGKKIEGDLNEPYRIAAKRGEQLGILVIPGCEITRQKPVGHINALSSRMPIQCCATSRSRRWTRLGGRTLW